jgi:hypothetical protein
MGASGSCHWSEAGERDLVQLRVEDSGLAASSTDDGGRGGEVEQPARKTAAAKIIPANLNTRPLCGTAKRIQAVSPFQGDEMPALVVKAPKGVQSARFSVFGVHCLKLTKAILYRHPLKTCPAGTPST